MKIKITHESGVMLRIDVPAKSVAELITAIGKFLPELVSAMPSIFQQARDHAAVEAAVKDQEERLKAAEAADEAEVAAFNAEVIRKRGSKKGSKR